MTDWGFVFGVIAAVATFLIAIGTPIIKLNTSITKLSVAVENLMKYVDKNDDYHKECSDTLADHETRIQLIENGSAKGVDK
jgi:hypothetical protein